MKQPEADRNVVGAAAVLHRNGAVQVDQAPLVAVVEDEDVDFWPESPEVTHHAQDLGFHNFRLAVTPGSALKPEEYC